MCRHICSTIHGVGYVPFSSHQMFTNDVCLHTSDVYYAGTVSHVYEFFLLISMMCSRKLIDYLPVVHHQKHLELV